MAFLGLLPGVLLERAASRPTGGYFGVLLASVLLRLFGTVALFVLCRYHLATSVKFTAVLTIGWYLFLTSIEVGVLAKQLPQTDQKSELARRSDAA